MNVRMSALSFDACREWFAKVQNRFANCFIRLIVPDSPQRHFRSIMFCGFGFSSRSFSNMAPHMVVEGVQVCMGSLAVFDYRPL